MGHAYNWLAEEDRKHINGIAMTYAEKQIQVELDCPTEIPNLVYEDVGEMTCVRFGRKDDLFLKNFVDVFCDDLELLLTRQQLTLKSFSLEYNGEEKDPNEEFLDPIIEKVFKTIEKSLASRVSPFPVSCVNLEPATVSQGASILKYLDPFKLDDFELSFLQRKQRVKYEVLPLNWDKHYNAMFTIDFNMETMKNWFSSGKLYQLPFLLDASISNGEASSKKGGHPNGSLHIFKDHVSFVKLILHGLQETDVEATVITAVEETSRKVLENPLILKLMATNFELFDIQSLRQVSAGIRNWIDEIKPNPHIRNYRVSLGTALTGGDKIEIAADTTSGAHRTVRYQSEGLRGERKFLHMDDVCPVALMVIESNLKQQKTCIEHFQVIYEYLHVTEPIDDEWDQFHSLYCTQILNENFSLGLETILKNRMQALKIQKISMGVMDQSQVMQILPYLDKSLLKVIEILCPTKQIKKHLNQNPKSYIDIDEISNTEQWKSAEQLISKCIISSRQCYIAIQDMRITHFAYLDILVVAIRNEDVSYLKTELLKSPTFQRFKIAFKCSEINENLHTLIGLPYHTIPDVKKIWYFVMPNPDYYLHIVLDTHDLLDQKRNPKPKSLVLTKVEKEDTPLF